MAHGAHVPCDMAHGAHFLSETRLLIEFPIGHTRSGGPFRYLGRLAIFLAQTFRAAGISIFSTQASGGDLDEHCHFQGLKTRTP